MNPEHDQNASQEPEALRVIYVVEDDPRMLELAALTLAGGPWQIKTFDDPEPALQSFTQETPKPALLLTDYSMRSMDGIELGKRCKQMHPRLRVVMMSGTAESDIADSATFELDAFVPKPFHPKALRDLVSSVVQQ
jgi:two-component system, cell cycle sensor histidine kinase and response regulator CckA